MLQRPPSTDGEAHLRVLRQTLACFCLSLDGDLLWSVPIEASATRLGWGTASSPVLHQDRIYIVNDNDDQSYLVALSKETGAEMWRANRGRRIELVDTLHLGKNETAHRDRYHRHRQGTIVRSGWQRAVGADRDVRRSRWTTPFSKFGLLYISSGLHRRSAAGPVLRHPARGHGATFPSLTGRRQINRSRGFQPQSASYNPSPIIYGDYYYTLLDRGYFTSPQKRAPVRRCTAASGSRWGLRSPRPRGPTNGKIFVLSEDGGPRTSSRPVPEFEVLGNETPWMSSPWRTPAIAHGSLFIRTASKLYRIREQAGSAQ